MYEKTNIWKTEYCTDQSWKELQKKDKWYAITPSPGKQLPGYSNIENKVVNYTL